MSLRERLESLPTKSLYFGVFLAMVATLSLSFVVFRQISVRLERRHFDPVYDRLDELQLETASRILHSDGQKALADYLTSLDRLSGARHFLLDAHGIDLVAGDNKAALLPPPPTTRWRIRTGGHTVASQISDDGQYWFAAVGHAKPAPALDISSLLFSCNRCHRRPLLAGLDCSGVADPQDSCLNRTLRTRRPFRTRAYQPSG